MKLQIKTLSPIHISTGNSREPFEYAIHNGRIYVLNPEACLNLLYEDNPHNIDQFMEWVSEIQEKIENLLKKRRKNRRGFSREENQQLSQLQRNFQIYYFADKVLGKPELAEKMVSDPQYYLYSGYFPGTIRGKRKLREQIKVKFLPYIPGSSLKGLFRTALLYSLVKNADNDTSKEMIQFSYQRNRPSSLMEIIHKLENLHEKAMEKVQQRGKYVDEINQLRKSIKRFENKLADGLEGFFFFCKNHKGEYTDPLFDIFKFVEVSDTNPSDVELTMYPLMSYTINRREKRFSSQLIDITEFIDEDSQLEFELNIKSDQIITLLKTSQSNGKWADLGEKLSRILGKARDELEKISPKELESLFIKRLFGSLQEFGNDIKQKDIEWLRLATARQNDSMLQFYDNLPELAVKIGFSSGWHATTVGYAMYQNPFLKEMAENVVYLFHLHLIQRQKNKLFPKNENQFNRNEWLKIVQIRPDMKFFPGSRRMVGRNEFPTLPVGWIQLGENIFQTPNSKNSTHVSTGEPETSSEDMDKLLEKLKEKFSG
jgi:CRISPR type III-A-associated RAMP protein Csm5